MSARALAAIVVITLAAAAAANLGDGGPPPVAADHTAGPGGSTARGPLCHLAPNSRFPNNPAVDRDPDRADA